jgi:hypothetical protein
VFREKLAAAIIRKRGKVNLFNRLNLRNIYFLLTNNNAEIYFSVLHATVVSSVSIDLVWTINYYELVLAISVKYMKYFLGF